MMGRFKAGGRWFAAGIFGLAVALAAGAAGAQLLNFSGKDGEAPIEIEADNGIEWQQDNQALLARGNAVATRGEVTVRADVLRAFYRKTADGSTEISRLDAQGRVEIASADERATGDAGVYDVDQAVLVLSGKKVRFAAGADTITADRQLEYYDRKLMAVARGNALAKREDRSLRARVLVAYLHRDAAGKTRVQRVDAFDDIHIVTVQDQAWADRGVYNVETGIATLTGSVRIEREGNTLTGCSADVNLNTGISTLKSCPGGSGRVRGLIQPGDMRGGKEKSTDGR